MPSLCQHAPGHTLRHRFPCFHGEPRRPVDPVDGHAQRGEVEGPVVLVNEPETGGAARDEGARGRLLEPEPGRPGVGGLRAPAAGSGRGRGPRAPVGAGERPAELATVEVHLEGRGREALAPTGRERGRLTALRGGGREPVRGAEGQRDRGGCFVQIPEVSGEGSRPVLGHALEDRTQRGRGGPGCAQGLCRTEGSDEQEKARDRMGQHQDNGPPPARLRRHPLLSSPAQCASPMP